MSYGQASFPPLSSFSLPLSYSQWGSPMPCLVSVGCWSVLRGPWESCSNRTTESPCVLQLHYSVSNNVTYYTRLGCDVRTSNKHNTVSVTEQCTDPPFDTDRVHTSTGCFVEHATWVSLYDRRPSWNLCPPGHPTVVRMLQSPHCFSVRSDWTTETIDLITLLGDIEIFTIFNIMQLWLYKNEDKKTMQLLLSSMSSGNQGRIKSKHWFTNKLGRYLGNNGSHVPLKSFTWIIVRWNFLLLGKNKSLFHLNKNNIFKLLET